MAGKLTQKAVNDLLATGMAGKHNDGGSLYLVITPKGIGSWVLRARIRDPGETVGRVRDIRLGRAGARKAGLVDLPTARRRADLAKNQIADGIDPRRSSEPEAPEPEPAGPTFADLVPKVIADQTAGARHPKTAAQWRSYLGETPRDQKKARNADAVKAHADALTALRSKLVEPRLVCRRLQLLRGWGYDEQDDQQVLT